MNAFTAWCDTCQKVYSANLAWFGFTASIFLGVGRMYANSMRSVRAKHAIRNVNMSAFGGHRVIHVDFRRERKVA